MVIHHQGFWHEYLYLSFNVKQDAAVSGFGFPLCIKPDRLEKCFLNCSNLYLNKD